MRYLALGDSISIDDYTGVKDGGAAAQFARRIGATEFHDLTKNGKITDGVIADLSDEGLTIPDLVTLTIGGNDLLLDQSLSRIATNLLVIMERLRVWRCPVILNTVYDPTDGHDDLIPEMASLRPRYEGLNEAIRRIAASYGFMLADLQELFHGHGIASHESWIIQEIEPNLAGASAIAARWHELFTAYADTARPRGAERSKADELVSTHQLTRGQAVLAKAGARGFKSRSDPGECALRDAVRSPMESSSAEQSPPAPACRTFGEISVRLANDNIAARKADVLVNAANNRLHMGGGVAAALRSRGGIEIHQEAVRKAPARIGSVVRTGAGALAARYVYHAVVIDYDVSKGTSVVDVAEVMRNLVNMAIADGVKSMALPLFGAGVGGLSVQTSLTTILEGLEAAALSVRSPLAVEIVVHDPGEFDEATAAFREYSGKEARQAEEDRLAEEAIRKFLEG